MRGLRGGPRRKQHWKMKWLREYQWLSALHAALSPQYLLAIMPVERLLCLGATEPCYQRPAFFCIALSGSRQFNLPSPPLAMIVSPQC